MHSRVYLGNSAENETVVPDPAYYTAVQVDALIAGLSRSFTADEISVKDESGFFNGKNVEAVLQEIGSELDGLQEIMEGI